MNNNFDQEEIEILDLDDEVKSKIDEVLDFDTPEQIKEEKKYDLNAVIQNKSDKQKVKNTVSRKKLNDYKDSIKDLNIKNKKVKKTVKHGLICTVIILLICIEFFINKTGEILTNLRVYATDNQPIRVIQNGKYGYIDYLGNVIVNPKYSYGENFIKGYAIVKDSSNIPSIINKGGKVVIPSGTYFSILRAGNDIIVSKVTKSGLKYGILTQDLKVKTEFKYDSINYEKNCFTYIKDNNVGIISLDGKDIYSYKLVDNMDKKISILSFDEYENLDEIYGVVYVNSSYLIVNLKNGKVITSPTLNEIKLMKNNVFKEIEKNKETFLYVQNNKVILESDGYENVEVPSINAGIIIATKKDFEKEYISVKTKEQISKKLNDENVYIGENIFMFTSYDYKTRNNMINLVKNGEIFKTINKTFDIISPFKNGFSVVKQYDNTYTFIDENGRFFSKYNFTNVEQFDKYGHAIVKTKDGYGVIDKDENIIIPFENNDVKMANYKYKSNSSGNKIFFAVKKDNLYSLYDVNGKNVKKDTYYQNVSFDENYPVIKLSDESYDYIYIPQNDSKILLTSSKSKYDVFENYIIYNNEYYNYKGKVIYVDNSKEGNEN